MLIALSSGLSCSDLELGQMDNGRGEAMVSVDFRVAQEQFMGSGADQTSGISPRSIANPGVETDEGTGVDYAPLDVWVMQYAGVADDAPLVGRPNYIELSARPINIQVAASAQDNTLVFVANTHDANIEWGDISTLSNFKLACKTITQESDCYGNNMHSSKDLILSGKYIGPIATGAISAELLRVIARIDFRLVNGVGSAMNLKSIQLCNVPKSLYYGGTTSASNVTSPTWEKYFNYPQETIEEALNPGSAQSFTFYTPINEQGTIPASISSKTKSALAPQQATYIKILATDAQNRATVYKIYPGANLINNYDLSPNRRYTLQLTINAPGDGTTDGRVEQFPTVDFASSNSFILNVAPLGTARRTFTIPIDKVNQFWASRDNNLTISESDTWVVDLIWQDTPTPKLINFADPVTGLPDATTFQGTGPAQRITLSVLSGSQGNALIGLKKVGHENLGYLWSWHLWITDYNPTPERIPTPGKHLYPVPDGHIHFYSGNPWTTPSGRYYNKYFMDRNLGARNPEYTTIGVLYYQYGRKDPMPMYGNGNALYDIQGVRLPDSDPRNASSMNKDAGKGVTLATGVLNPTFFYYNTNPGYQDWTSQGEPMGYMWNNHTAGSNIKSIYDPCPSGWKIPLVEAFQDFTINYNNPLNSTILDAFRDKRLGWIYQNIKALRYWPRTSPVQDAIAYPALGHRAKINGLSNGLNSSSIYWTAQNGADKYGNYLHYPILSIGGGDSRCFGFLVRCLQE